MARVKCFSGFLIRRALNQGLILGVVGCSSSLLRLWISAAVAPPEAMAYTILSHSKSVNR